MSKRAAKTAAPPRVYRMLYDAYGPQHWWPARGAQEMVIGAILTQNTAWTNVEKALTGLRRARLMSLTKLAEADPQAVEEAIRPSGYYRQKAKKLAIFGRRVRDNHVGSLKRMFALPAGELRAELLSIWGVGRETADSIVLYGAGKPIFVVDAYTRRIGARLGWPHCEADYDRLREYIEGELPCDARIFNEFHALIVRHAKSICKKSKPLCEQCALASICPAA